MYLKFFLSKNKTKTNFQSLPVIEFSLCELRGLFSTVTLQNKFRDQDHKKSFGKTIFIGGTDGYLGALLLSTQSALRTGTRYLVACTTEKHSINLPIKQNELISVKCEDSIIGNLNAYSVIIIGPGLSSDSWSSIIADNFSNEITSGGLSSKIIADAGYLYHLSKKDIKYHNWILTPHEGEAAKLLNKSSDWVRKHREESCYEIQKKYGGVVILKGANTLVNTGEVIYVCKHGGHYMGVAGMGDVLTGIIGSMITIFKNDFHNAILFSVGLHSFAADMLNEQKGSIGILPSDVIEKMSELLNNPENIIA